MNDQTTQRTWSEARSRLAAAVTALGFSRELADLCARQLGSPKAIDRLTRYVQKARPRSEEMLVDEMLAIHSEVERWREKKSSEAAQAYYSAWLNSEEREP